LPEDYRELLVPCNGGSLGGSLRFTASKPGGNAINVCINHIGRFREESYFSPEEARAVYQRYEVRIPTALIWIMDAPFGNAICLGTRGEHRRRVYFWDHENEPAPERWDGRVETAGNFVLLASTFVDFIGELAPTPK